jgi:hypothetical protein
VFEELAMRPIRIITAVIFATAIALTGCSAHSGADQPSPPQTAPNPTHTPRPVDQQALIYAAVLRQYLTSGDGNDGGEGGFGGRRFPRIFVLDHAEAVLGGSVGQGAEDGAPISPAVRRSITQALTDVGPLTFVASREEVIVEPRGCTHVRDHGILITLGPVEGTGDRVQVVVDAFVSCLGADSLTYEVQQTSSSGDEVIVELHGLRACPRPGHPDRPGIGGRGR